MQLIDVREPYERDAGHIAGSRHLELTKLTPGRDVARERPVVFYCRVGLALADGGAGLPRLRLSRHTPSAAGSCAGRRRSRPLVPEGGYVAEH